MFVIASYVRISEFSFSLDIRSHWDDIVAWSRPLDGDVNCIDNTVNVFSFQIFSQL